MNKHNRFKITKENIDHIRNHWVFSNELSNEIYLFLLDTLEKISPEKIDQEKSEMICEIDKQDSFYLLLISTNNNPRLEISIYKNRIEFFPPNSITDLEYSIKKLNLSYLKEQFYLWFSKDITLETFFYKENVLKNTYIYDDDIILTSSKSINYIFKKPTKRIITKYDAWI